MKTFIIIIVNICITFQVCANGSWEFQHAITNQKYEAITFNGEDYLCLYDVQISAKSANLIDWTESGISLDDSLYQTEMSGGVWLDLMQLTALPSGQYLAILLKTQYPQMGNAYIRTTHSVVSSDGNTWHSPQLIDYVGGTLYNSHLAQRSGTPLLVVGDYPDGWIMGPPPSRCEFYIYSTSSNSWQNTQYICTTPGQQMLCSDADGFYFSYSKHLDWWTTEQAVISSLDGLNWNPIGSNFISVADSHAGMILGNEYAYTPGNHWEMNATNTALQEIKYNGNIIVGFEEHALLVSYDFGTTWDRTDLGESTPISIIEAGSKFVALVHEPVPPENPIHSTKWNSLFYSINSQPHRRLSTQIPVLACSKNSIGFNAESNVVYQIESKSSLFDSEWNPYGLPIVGSGGSIESQINLDNENQIFIRCRTISLP